MLDGLRAGQFVENRDLKVRCFLLHLMLPLKLYLLLVFQCYMLCIAQSAGTVML